MLHIVLVEPEIPQNTGSIGRLALAIGASLHLVEPLGFDIDESSVRRAGLDYWQYLDLRIHKSTDQFIGSIPSGAEFWFFSKKATLPVFEAPFSGADTYLIFGKETSGLPEDLVNKFPLRCLRIPILDARVRSINLSQAVAVGAYEYFRKIKFLN